jgi:drug/metabolite transporter (DMT)-like permease
VIAQNMPLLGPACVVLAALVLLPWMYYAGGFAQLRQWSAQRWLGMVAAGATGVFGYAAFFLSGLQYLPAGKALVITLNPVVTLLLAVWIFKERLNRTIALHAAGGCGRGGGHLARAAAGHPARQRGPG